MLEGRQHVNVVCIVEARGHNHILQNKTENIRSQISSRVARKTPAAAKRSEVSIRLEYVFRARFEINEEIDLYRRAADFLNTAVPIRSCSSGPRVIRARLAHSSTSSSLLHFD